VVAIGQQVYQTKFAKNKLTLADLKKMPKKESWLQKKMRDAQEMAAAQGKAIPGQQQGRIGGKNGQQKGSTKPKKRG